MIEPKTIKEMRQSLGITQRQVASAIGVSQAHISKIEKGKVDPRLSTVNRILVILSTKNSGSCSQIMTGGVKTISYSEPVKRAIKLMDEFDISQLPVIQGNKPVGIISEGDIISNLDEIEDKTVGQIMRELPPIVSPSTSIDMVSQILQKSPVVLVSDKGQLIGIIARSDLMRYKCK